MYRKTQVLTLFVLIWSCKASDYQPTQIHIAYGATTQEIVVSWSTAKKTNESTVRYGIEELDRRAEGTSLPFNISEYISDTMYQYIHTVRLVDLEPNSTYIYRCGSIQGWSDEYSFRIPPNDGTWQPNLLVYGDLGVENAVSLPDLMEEAESGLFDAVLHVGDIGYDLYEMGSRRTEQFLNLIQPIASHLPYMTCPGNHESNYNYSIYRHTFQMPNNPDRPYYSLNLGPIHLISISTELYYPVNTTYISQQHEWLHRDLTTANQRENRRRQPWIIIIGHRPMYCSTTDGMPCSYVNPPLRVGVDGEYGLEEVLNDYGVDLYVAGHIHAYERLRPVYDYVVIGEGYVDPGAVVQVATGAAGNREMQDTFREDVPDWSGFRSVDYGYSRMKVYNATHLYWEQVAAWRKEVIDNFWLVKNEHKPYDKV